MKIAVIITLAFVACFVFTSCVPQETQESVYEGDLFIEATPGLKFASKFTSITGDLTISQDDLEYWEI